MCGIAGFAGSSLTGESSRAVLRAMTDALLHRGPDGSGYHLEERDGVGLGHRRLAVVDLTVEGRQPMVSALGRYVIAFNGEVYNFERLRPELLGRGHAFRGHSDTEVMLAAIEEWGIDAALRRFNGMFAFALWDRAERRLHLARDRLGKKPLYYSTNAGKIVFGSELKALLAYPGLPLEVDREAACLYARLGYIPTPWSVFRDVRKLEAGSYLTATLNEGRVAAIEQKTYWSADAVFAAGRERRFSGSYQEAAEELERLITDAVGLRMVADVPLGAFLSGGIDSSTIVALMQVQSRRPVRTFTIGFSHKGYSEAEHAAAVARHLGTEHTELYLEPEAALDLIPRLPQFYDEPFADSSQLPTMLVSRLAREHVTVALSGDAGDELFCGYNRYLWWRRLWRTTHRGPRWPWRLAAHATLALSAQRWDSVLSPVFGLLPRSWRHSSPGNRLHKLAEALQEDDAARLYLRWITHWEQPERVVSGGKEPLSDITAPMPASGMDAYTEAMMLRDIKSYLPDDIMVKVDRASMSASLEARAPLMDHRVVEFAASLPLDFKLKGGKGKRILREVLYRYVPQNLVERPKTGFAVPIDAWLRGPLRDWAENLMSARALQDCGVFETTPVRKAWQEHLSGRVQRQYPLWNVLMYQAWHQHWCSAAALAAQPRQQAAM